MKEKQERDLKLTAFCSLFGDPEALAELLNALEPGLRAKAADVKSIKKNFMNAPENDISVLLTQGIGTAASYSLFILVQQQTKVSENMPFRMMDSYFRLTHGFWESKELPDSSYPRPRFFVLYNGPEPYPDNSEMTLSNGEKGWSTDTRVHVLNVNMGCNGDLLARSPSLNGYATLMQKFLECQDLENDGLLAARAAISQ